MNETRKVKYSSTFAYKLFEKKQNFPEILYKFLSRAGAEKLTLIMIGLVFRITIVVVISSYKKSTFLVPLCQIIFLFESWRCLFTVQRFSGHFRGLAFQGSIVGSLTSTLIKIFLFLGFDGRLEISFSCSPQIGVQQI